MSVETNETIEEFADYESQISTFKFVMNINGILSLSISILAVYMICWHSSKHMGTYKWYLLNIVIWACIFDVYLGLLYAPQLVLPAVGICTHGAMKVYPDHKYLVASFLMFIWVLGCLGISVSFAFLYRWYSITHSIRELHRPRTLTFLIAFQIFFSVPTMLPALYGIYFDYSSVLKDIAESYPAAYLFSNFNNHPCTFLSLKVTPIACIIFFSMAIIQVSGCVLANVLAIFMLLKKINDNKQFMSNRTFQMHRQLTISLGVQFIIPTFFVGIPFIAIFVLALLGNSSNSVIRFVGILFFEMISMHSSLNSIAMLLMTKVYRNKLLNGIIFCFPQLARLAGIKHHETTFGLTRTTNSHFIHRPKMSLAQSSAFVTPVSH